MQNGKLYGVGNLGGIYTLSTRSGDGTKVGQLTVALQGTRFGVDFNPAANRLRVISDTGQNLRHNIDDPAAPTTTTVDGTLTYPPATTPATRVTGAAYTNNDLDPNTATTLFDLDTMLDQIAIQSPANSGSLAATGKLGVNASANAGFDIYSTVRGGTTVDLEGYAVMWADGRMGLFEINLLSGKATSAGEFPKKVTDIATRSTSDELTRINGGSAPRPTQGPGRFRVWAAIEVGIAQRPPDKMRFEAGLRSGHTGA